MLGAATAEANGASDYERSRMKNMATLHREASAALKMAAQASSNLKSAQQATKHIRKERRPRLPKAPVPRRASARIRGSGELGTLREATGAGVPGSDLNMSSKDFLKAHGKKPLLEVDGMFRGWVCEEVRERWGIAEDAAAAWEDNGGGKWTLSNQLGSEEEMNKAKLLSAAKGWSEAKAVSAMLLYKNPNQYFYRNCEPGVEHWHGAWAQWEHDLFLEVARKHGCGNKWGLFSSYIPHRVGYQCSQYYRKVIVAEGHILDPTFAFDYRGQPVYGSVGTTQSEEAEE